MFTNRALAISLIIMIVCIFVILAVVSVVEYVQWDDSIPYSWRVLA